MNSILQNKRIKKIQYEQITFIIKIESRSDT